MTDKIHGFQPHFLTNRIHFATSDFHFSHYLLHLTVIDLRFAVDLFHLPVQVIHRLLGFFCLDAILFDLVVQGVNFLFFGFDLGFKISQLLFRIGGVDFGLTIFWVNHR